MPNHLHLDGGVIFGDHLVHEQGHVGDGCSRPFTRSETFPKLCLPAKECVRGESWARPEDAKGEMNGMRVCARDGDRKAGSGASGEYLGSARERSARACSTALSRHYDAFHSANTVTQCYMGSLIRAILALSPRDVGSIPKRKKKPTVPQSEFVYSALGCRAVAMSSNICGCKLLENLTNVDHSARLQRTFSLSESSPRSKRKA